MDVYCPWPDGYALTIVFGRKENCCCNADTCIIYHTLVGRKKGMVGLLVNTHIKGIYSTCIVVYEPFKSSWGNLRVGKDIV